MTALVSSDNPAALALLGEPSTHSRSPSRGRSSGSARRCPPVAAPAAGSTFRWCSRQAGWLDSPQVLERHNRGGHHGRTSMRMRGWHWSPASRSARPCSTATSLRRSTMDKPFSAGTRCEHAGRGGARAGAEPRREREHQGARARYSRRRVTNTVPVSGAVNVSGSVNVGNLPTSSGKLEVTSAPAGQRAMVASNTTVPANTAWHTGFRIRPTARLSLPSSGRASRSTTPMSRSG